MVWYSPGKKQKIRLYTKFTNSTNLKYDQKCLYVLQTPKPSNFFLSSFLILSLFVPSRCRCRVYLTLITHNDARTHTHIPRRTPLDEWSARRRELYLRTNSTHRRHIHASSGIQTRNPNKQAAADPRLRPRGHRVHLNLARNCQKYKSHLIDSLLPFLCSVDYLCKRGSWTEVFLWSHTLKLNIRWYNKDWTSSKLHTKIQFIIQREQNPYLT